MRSNQILVFFVALLIVLGIRLFIVTGVQGADWQEAADTNTIKKEFPNLPIQGNSFDKAPP
jgi:cell division protein FtsI/penicillin-binding protein 2